MSEAPGNSKKVNLTYLSMLISACPIVNTFLSPRVEQPDIQRVYRINKKLRFCFHQSASRPRLLPEVLFVHRPSREQYDPASYL